MRKKEIPQLENAEKRETLNVIREECRDFWSRGLINHPDFTLHGIQHTENIIKMLKKLIDASPIQENEEKLNRTELFLLEAAAYLHDIGMLIDLDGFIEERADKYWKQESTWEGVRKRVITEWEFDEPKEHVSIYNITPLDELKLRVIFPKGYIVKKEKRGHEVRFANTRGVLIDEREKKLSDYSDPAKGERQTLELHADNPRLFGSYYLLWEPPN